VIDFRLRANLSLLQSYLFLKAKFLVDHEGKPFKRFGPTTNPYDIKADIDELLKKREA